MERVLLIFLSLILAISVSSCGNKQVSNVKLPDGVSQVEYNIASKKTYEPYSGACDIYNASAKELKKINLVSYDKSFGLVNNERTAVDIATIVFKEVYTDSDCNIKEAPFLVHYNDNAKAWIVHGTLPPKFISSGVVRIVTGGVASIAIEKETGEILMILHTK